MLPHVAPTRTKCTVFGYAPAGAIERLLDHDPRQQRAEGHSRSYSKSITASQSTRMLLHVVPGQPVCLNSPSPHKLPRRALAYRPPKGNGAVRSRMQSSQVPVAPACHCAVLVQRPHAVCVNRAAGIVALLPFHAPAVPFAAAIIPPHCPSLPAPLLPPLPAAFCGRVPRLRRSPRPQNAVPYSTTTNQSTIKPRPPYPETV